jgi:hypothetical protein
MNPRDRYVRELERRLPFAFGLRARVVAEVREHLRDGGEEALARFGPVEELAAQLGRELRPRAVARASWFLPVIVAAFVFPLYVLPENTLPPAPWAEKPDYLEWKQHVALAAFLIALGLAATAFVAARLRPTVALVPLVGSVAALGTAVVFSAIVAVQWIDAVPGTSAATMYAGIAAAAFLLAAAALVVGESCRLFLSHGRNELAAD